MTDPWRGLRGQTRSQLTQREYRNRSLADRLASDGVGAGELLQADRAQLPWIPGVELFPRRIFPQRHRGFFGELARADEGVLAKIGLWPQQWAAARMFARTAKGFHIHPPHIPQNEDAEAWFRRLYIENPNDFSSRPYDNEQWDVMFFIQGVAELILVDERSGLDRRVMRVFIDGDDHRGADNAAIVIPPGVAHALRAEGSSDVIMVYGTSTKFDPAFEGRMASEVESAPLPPEWQNFIGS